jgi:hypothetical protein
VNHRIGTPGLMDFPGGVIMAHPYGAGLLSVSAAPLEKPLHGDAPAGAASRVNSRANEEAQ